MYCPELLFDVGTKFEFELPFESCSSTDVLNELFDTLYGGFDELNPIGLK